MQDMQDREDRQDRQDLQDRQGTTDAYITPVFEPKQYLKT